MFRPTVLHIVTSLDFGGVERHIETIAQVMHLSKMRHVFVAIGGGGATADKLLSMGFDCQCLMLPIKIFNISTLKSL